MQKRQEKTLKEEKDTIQEHNPTPLKTLNTPIGKRDGF